MEKPSPDSRSWRIQIPGMALALLLGMQLWCTAQDLTTNITLVGQLDPVGGADQYGDIWAEGDYAYLGSFAARGVRIIDISTPTSPLLVAHYDPASGGRFKDVKVSNGVGYFASDNGGGLHIVDVSNPASPSLITNLTSAHGGYDSIHNVSVANGYLYEAASGTAVVKVFDISNPATPTFVRNIETSDSAVHDVTAIGNRLYASGIGSGMTYVYDVSGIGTGVPPLLATLNTGGDTHSSWARDDGLLLVTAREVNNGDVRIIDISDLGNPVTKAVLTASSLGISGQSPHNPILMGDLLFISWYDAGLQVVDISNPTNPVHIGAYDMFPGTSSGFDGNWGVYPFLGLDRIIVSDLQAGLLVLDAREADTNLFTLSWVVTGGLGHVTPTAGLYEAWVPVTVTAVASSFYEFVSWTGDLSGTAVTTHILMSANVSIEAILEAILVTNGVPQWWLAENNLGTNDIDALSDQDGDGLLTWEEFYACTQPTNTFSVFELTALVQMDGSDFVIQWSSASGKTYAVYISTNLISGFSLLSNNLASTPPTNFYTDSSAVASPVIYRVTVAP